MPISRHHVSVVPELPEVEYAAGRLRDAAAGHTIAAVTVHHPAQRRQLPPRARKALQGQVIERVERRAKVQLLHLSGGGVLEVHFRMTGDWMFSAADDAPPAFERVRIETREGVRVSLVDPRALSVVRWHAPGTYTPPPTGPEPLTDAFSVEAFAGALARRRSPIKPMLLDQRIVAGVGNIYASEALWEARIKPTAPANSLSRARVERLRDAIRTVLTVIGDARYYTRDAGASEIDDRFRVYGREGEPCRRCGSAIARFDQAGRSTFWCRRCQR
jgi:formamidopyrimidine-DNA glycosylase